MPRSRSWTAGSARTRASASVRSAASIRCMCSSSPSKASPPPPGTNPVLHCASPASCAGAGTSLRRKQTGSRTSADGYNREPFSYSIRFLVSATRTAGNQARFPLSVAYMSSRTVLILGAAAVLVGGSWYLISREKPVDYQGRGFNPWEQPVAVRTVPAIQESLAQQVRSIGTVVPFNTVVVRSRVEGPLLRVVPREGQQVRAGDLLAEIDPAPYRIRLSQAEGAQQQNVAQLRHAQLELEQYQRVIEAGTIPRQTLDRQQALVNQLQGTLKSDQAQVDTARLQLDYTRIVAPIAGRVGLRRVDAGNLVNPGDPEGLFTITQTRPISVLMSIPEAELPAVREGLAAGRPMVVQAYGR